MTSARALLGDQTRFVIGVDLRKDAAILVPAYDDAAGVTAQFNLNLLTRINRELGADFDLSGFAHRAIWNDAASRIEMHLESLSSQNVVVGGRSFSFKSGETIHTENSYKFVLSDFLSMCKGIGFDYVDSWSDERNYFAEILLKGI